MWWSRRRELAEKSLGDALLIRESENAICVRLDSGQTQWLPKSVIVSYGGDEATPDDLIVDAWFAKKEGL